MVRLTLSIPPISRGEHEELRGWLREAKPTIPHSSPKDNTGSWVLRRTRLFVALGGSLLRWEGILRWNRIDTTKAGRRGGATGNNMQTQWDNLLIYVNYTKGNSDRIGRRRL